MFLDTRRPHHSVYNKAYKKSSSPRSQHFKVITEIINILIPSMSNTCVGLHLCQFAHACAKAPLQQV